MKDDYTTNSNYLTYIFSLWRVGRMCFLNLGVKGLKKHRGHLDFQSAVTAQNDNSRAVFIARIRDLAKTLYT